jgi:RNA polymerase sigma-70 factor (ECF subfamily)
MCDYQKKIINDRFTRGLIHRKIKQIVGRAGFTNQDHKDLEQRLLLRVLQAIRRFDPNHAHLNVFVTTVIERDIANILRDKKAKKRDHRRICSLNVVIANKDKRSIELGDTIGQREHDTRLGRSVRSGLDLAQFTQDMKEVIADLPPELRNLAEAMKTDSISKIARCKGLPRTTLNYYVQQLRQRFEQAGLKDYL